MAGLPTGWQLRHSRTHNNQPYYFNETTGATQWDPPVAAAGEPSSRSRNKVHVHHLLIKHAGSRRPSSWRQETITLSEEDAVEEARALRRDIYADGDGLLEGLKRRARERSDCSSAKRDGDLGYFGPGEMQSTRRGRDVECHRCRVV